MFNHFFNFMYEINIFEHKRSKDFYRMLKKAVLKKILASFLKRIMKDDKRVKVI